MSQYNLGTASGRIEIDGKGASAGFKVAETAANTFFDVVNRKVESIKQLGRRLAATGGAGVAGFGLAIRAAAGFEKQMSGVRAVTNSSEAEFESLRQKALQLGADTAYSASEAALAIEELAKAGIPVKDILNGAAAGAVALAAAGGIGLAEAATISANAMNQFGLSADKIPEVADILAGVANTSAADVSGIGQSLSQAGAVANLAGMSFRDTAIAIGEMADAGINGSDAGTSLKTMLNNLIPVTDKQTAKFEELGLLEYDLAKANKVLTREGLAHAGSIDVVKDRLAKYVDEIGNGTKGTARNRAEVQKLLMSNGALSNQFFDQKGNIKGLAGVQGELGNALKGMTKEQKLSTLEVLFGADAMRATAILSLAGAKGYREFSAAVAQTSAAEVAKTRLDNLSGATEAFKGSMETAMITIGSVFLPIVTKIVQGATAIINAFNNLPGPVKTAIAIIAGIVSVVMVLVGTLLASISVIAAFVAQFYLMSIIRVATSAIKAYVVAVRGGAASQVAFRAAMAASNAQIQRTTLITRIATKVMLTFSKAARAAWLALTGPIGIVILAIMALVAVGALLYNKWAPFRNLVNTIGAALKGAFLSAWAALKPAIAAGMAILQKVGDYISSTLMPVIRAVGAVLMGKLLTAWKSIGAAIQSQLMPAVNQLISKFQGSVVPAFQKAVTAVAPLAAAFMRFAAVIGGGLLTAIIAIGKAFIDYVLPVLIKIVGFLLGVVIGAVVGFVKGVIQAITGLIQIFTGLIDFFAGLFTGNWSRMWNGVKTIFIGIWNLIIGALKAYLSIGILKVVGLAFRGLMAIVRGSWNLILGLFRAAGRGILTIIRGAFRLVMSIIRTSIAVWRSIISAGWRAIQAVIRGVLNAIKAVISGVWRFITSLIKGQMSQAKGIVSSGWNTVKSLTTRAWDAIKNAVGKAIDNVIDLVRSIPGKVTSALGNLGNTLYNAGLDLIGGLARGITNKISDAVGAVQSGLSRIRGLLPGSPIKWGPLKDWNQGGAGKRLMKVLASGLSDTTPIEKAMRGVARYISGVEMMVPAMGPHAAAALAPQATFAATNGPLAAAGVKTRPKAKGSGGKASRLVSGTLSIGPDGQVWIEGIARDVYEEEEEFKNSRGGGGRRD